jgi:hypothetical protein
VGYHDDCASGDPVARLCEINGGYHDWRQRRPGRPFMLDQQADIMTACADPVGPIVSILYFYYVLSSSARRPAGHWDGRHRPAMI